MLINIIDVGQPNTHAAKNGRSYQSIEVTYKAENGQVANKKLMSFSNPSVFNHIKSLTKGAVLNVTTTKDAAGYWQWTGIGDDNVSETTTQTKPASTGGGRVTGSNYETKEERAARQVYIIRQSSLSTAVDLLGTGAKVADVIATAKEFESYVFAKDPNPTKEVNFDDLEDDIPV
jgi:hypothetical protein